MNYDLNSMHYKDFIKIAKQVTCKHDLRKREKEYNFLFYAKLPTVRKLLYTLSLQGMSAHSPVLSFLI